MLIWFHNVTVQFSNFLSTKKVALQCHDFCKNCIDIFVECWETSPGTMGQTSRETRQAGRQADAAERHIEDRRTNENDRRAEREAGKKLADKLALPDNIFGAAGHKGSETGWQGRQTCMARSVWGWALGLSWGWGLGPKISGAKPTTQNQNWNFRILKPCSPTLEICDPRTLATLELRNLGALEPQNSGIPGNVGFWRAGTLKLRNLHVSLQL